MSLRTLTAVALAAPALLLTAAPAAALDLRADADRDGALTAADDAPGLPGALLLANLDDDGGRCAADLNRRLRARLRLDDLGVCSDASDASVNGAQDERDLARVELLPDPAATAPATVSVEGPGRVFAPRGTWQPATTLTVDELRAGTQLAVEGTDIARDPATTTVKITVGDASVTLRLAPLIVPDATRTAETLLADVPESKAEIRAEARRNRALSITYARKVLADKRKGRTVPPTMRGFVKSERTIRRHYDEIYRRQVRFAEGQRSFLTGLERAVGRDVRQQDWVDPWVQDAFEPAYQAVPVAGGGAQVMRVAIMSGTLVERGEIAPTNFHARRFAGILRNLRGADSAVVHHRDAPGAPSGLVDAWLATGTMEATPPVPGAPNGRLIVGGRSKDGVEGATRQLVDAQGGAQPLIELYTGWLDIGHTDEMLAFVNASTPRGWAVVVADPEAALATLRKVPGRTPVLKGLKELDGTSAQVTAKEVLDGPIARASRFAAENIETQLATLRRELGLTDADIVRVPVLYTWESGKRYVKAFTGNTVNGVAPAGRTFLAVDPHGPVTRSGDLYRAATTTALAKVGVTTRFVDTWPLPHLGTGELHCMTNALRDLGDARWWTR